jgi:muconate cycloisomerase
MKPEAVTGVAAWLVSVPMWEEWAASPEMGGHILGGNRLILRVQDASGHEGWGEGNTALGPEQIDPVLRLLPGKKWDELHLPLLDLWPVPTYYHQPAAPSPYAPNLANLAHRLRHPLQAPVEMALLDLLARRAEVPLHLLFGGACRRAVPVDYWMGRTTPEHAKRCVARAKALGFTGIKLKTTLEDPNVERLEAIREEGGPDWSVTVDPNGRFYRLDDALATIQAMDAVGNMEVLEDPFPRFHLPEFAALRPRIRARVVVHIDPVESFHSVVTSGAAGGLNIGSEPLGMLGWRYLAAAADRANLPIWQGSGLDLGIATAAQLHACAAAPNCQLPGDQAGPWLRESTLVRTPFVVRDGCVEVPAGPGLGVEIDYDALSRYTQHHWDFSA